MIVPEGVIRRSWFPKNSVNHTFPSGPAAMPQGVAAGRRDGELLDLTGRCTGRNGWCDQQQTRQSHQTYPSQAGPSTFEQTALTHKWLGKCRVSHLPHLPRGGCALRVGGTCALRCESAINLLSLWCCAPRAEGPARGRRARRALERIEKRAWMLPIAGHRRAGHELRFRNGPWLSPSCT